MAEFPHLPIPRRLSNIRKKGSNRRGSSESQTSINIGRRAEHGQFLSGLADSLSQTWTENLELRKNKGLPEITDPNIIPLYLKIDPDTFDIEALRGFGIEIISEEENGFIIGSSNDNFHSLKEKIDTFLRNNERDRDKNQAAKLWDIVLGDQWKIEKILSTDLQKKWNTIQDDQEFYVDLGIACYTWVPDEKPQKPNETVAKFNRRREKWLRKYESELRRRDELSIERQEKLTKRVTDYGGEIIDNEFVEFDDSFCCRIRINGKGLKDIALTFQYLFEITEYDSLAITSSITNVQENAPLVLTAPTSDSAKVCVIDSGINEAHKLLNPAILTNASKSYIPNDPSTADQVSGGGHGTRVSGAVLYANDIPRNSNYQLPCWIYNARILDGGNNAGVPMSFFPRIMKEILDDFPDSSFFNLSVNYTIPHDEPHMPQWAASIDQLIFERRKLFIISAGNVDIVKRTSFKCVKEFINSGHNYPNYLLEKDCEITNPAHSSFALTVGSICISEFDDGIHSSFGKRDLPSSFSRTGLGMWGMIKPEVVEYGGDFAFEKSSTAPNINITQKPEISPELVKSGMDLVGKDTNGTSFSTPKVSHIAALLKNNYPSESALMHKTLIVQSARLPGNYFETPTLEAIRHFGYGIPTIERAISNNPKRITFIANDQLPYDQANVYKVNIPNEINRPGLEYNVLVEITLSYLAKPRRTRRNTDSYLSTWMEWKASRNREPYDVFCERVLTNDDNPTTRDAITYTGFDWKIGEKRNVGINGIRRNDSTTQKDWTIIPSNQLPDEFAIAIVARKGWERKPEFQVPYAFAVSFEILDNESEINLYNSLKIANEIELGSGEEQIRFTE